MRTHDKHGLIGAGAVPRSFLSRLPSLQRKLGPIKGTTYSTGRKLVETLRSGHAVQDYSPFATCPVIWVMVPEDSLDAVLAGLAAEVHLYKTIVVLCGTARESPAFHILKSAHVATLQPVDDSRSTGFVAEGHRDALHLLLELFRHERRKLFQVRTGTKAAYLASVQLMTTLMRALVTSAINCLQVTGISRLEAVELATVLATRSVRAHGRAGAAPWSAPELEELRHAIEQRTHELRALCPVESHAYAAVAQLALEYFERLGAPKKTRTHHA